MVAIGLLAILVTLLTSVRFRPITASLWQYVVMFGMIAAGCGLDVVDVNRLLKQFEGMQQIIKQVTGGRKPGFGFGGLGHGRGLRKRKKK